MKNSDDPSISTRPRAGLIGRTMLTTAIAMALMAGTVQAQAAPAAPAPSSTTTQQAATTAEQFATTAITNDTTETSTELSAAAAGLVNLGDHFYSGGGFCHVGKRYRLNANSTAQLDRFKKAMLNPRNGVPGLRYDFVRTTGAQLEFYTYHVLRESYWGIPAGHCSIAKVTPHKGRATLALPSWAKGVIAALASAA
ncbi:hypothetical protein DFR72_117199, partial [Lentzea flaviverrucosa]